MEDSATAPITSPNEGKPLTLKDLVDAARQAENVDDFIARIRARRVTSLER